MKTEGQVVYDNLKSVRRLLNMPFAKSKNKYNELKNVIVSYVEVERIDDALELLKKQVPIQPKKVLQAGVAREYYRCFCPECGTHVGNILNGKRADVVSYFCQNCGQAVEWDG